MIFVFGSNLKGIHGVGAAATARQCYGAVPGVGRGRTGNAYAIPTKVNPHQVRPLPEIERSVKEFLQYAESTNDLFKVTRIGCGYAGYLDSEIAPMFKNAPINCIMDMTWSTIVGVNTPNGLSRYFFNSSGYFQLVDEAEIKLRLLKTNETTP